MISNRLSKIVDFIDFEQNIADIGSDHGYVLIELRKRGFKNRLLGVENKVEPFKRLEKNIKLNNINDIETSLSSGLNEVTKDFNTIIIAGMGFETIKNIVNEDIDKIKNIDHFIIDCHTCQQNVRPFFVSLGYYIKNEEILFEDGIYYDVILFEKAKEKPEYTSLELEFGPFILKNRSKTFIERINSEISKNNVVIDKIGDPTNSNSIKLTDRNKYLKGVFYEN